MEELNLKKVSIDLSSASPKISPGKQVKPRVDISRVELIPMRRSNRFADNAPVSYKEVSREPLLRFRRGYSYRRRDPLNRFYASDAIDKAVDNNFNSLGCNISI